jgi:hypothetical protein
MKDTEFKDLLHCKVQYGAIIPKGQSAIEFIETNAYQDVYLLNQTPRDAGFHACYFALMGYIWEAMPPSFKKYKCPNKANMYKYMKLISGQYKIEMSFKDKEAIEFESISFAKMNEQKFKEYVNEQLSYFYTEILVPLEMEEFMQKIEKEFKKFMEKLI